MSNPPRPDQPARVKALFVGESPPASGRNFYRADSGLYRAIREAFVAADPMFDVDDFPAAFLNVGCYLIDLCTEPVDCLPARDRRLACRASEAQLAETISDLRPRSVITVLRSIEANVARALAKAHWYGPVLSLPYPGRWSTHKTVFVSSLRVALPELLDDLALSKDWCRQNTSATARELNRPARTPNEALVSRQWALEAFSDATPNGGSPLHAPRRAKR